MPLTPSPRPVSAARRLLSSLALGVVIAVVTHVVIVIVFFATNGSSAENLQPISSYFLPASIALAVLATLGALLTATRSWFWALLVGLIPGVLASLVGTVWLYLTANAALDWPAILATLAGASLLYVVTAAVATVVLRRPVWSRLDRVANGPARPLALVRQPSSRLEEGQVTHIGRTAVDLDLADEQWSGYVAALEANGFEVIEVAVSDEHPDSVFVEDAVVIFGTTAVITSPGAESRRGEIDAVPAALKPLRLTERRIELPGTLDGGDVLVVDDTVYVGRGGRTNAEGIAQLRAIVAPLGYTVVAVPVTKVLHLKSAVTALPDGTVIGYAKNVEHAGLFPRFLAVPEPEGAAVVQLAPDTVLMSASAPKSAALIESLGYRVVTVDIGEFEKLEGCVTCLSVRID